jgi:hypothetical protein
MNERLNRGDEFQVRGDRQLHDFVQAESEVGSPMSSRF